MKPHFCFICEAFETAVLNFLHPFLNIQIANNTDNDDDDGDDDDHNNNNYNKVDGDNNSNNNKYNESLYQ